MSSDPPSIGYTCNVYGSVSAIDTSGNEINSCSLSVGVWMINATAVYDNSPNANILVLYDGGAATWGLNNTYANTIGKSNTGKWIYAMYNMNNGSSVLCGNTCYGGGASNSNQLSASNVLVVDSKTTVSLYVWGQTSGDTIWYSLSATRIG